MRARGGCYLGWRGDNWEWWDAPLGVIGSDWGWV